MFLADGKYGDFFGFLGGQLKMDACLILLHEFAAILEY